MSETGAGPDDEAWTHAPTPELTVEQAAAVLGVSATASHAEVTSAYRVRARLVHPDRLSGAPVSERVTASIAMQQLNEALGVMRADDSARTDVRPPVATATSSAGWSSAGPHPRAQEGPSTGRARGTGASDRPKPDAAPRRRPRTALVVGLSIAGLVVVAAVVALSVLATTLGPPIASTAMHDGLDGNLAGTCWEETGDSGELVETTCDSPAADHVVTVSVLSSDVCGERDWMGPTRDGGPYGERYWCLAPLEGDVSAALASPEPVPAEAKAQPLAEAGGPSGSWPKPFDDSDIPRTVLEVHGDVTGRDAEMVVDVLEQRGLAINTGDYEDAFAWFSAEYLTKRETTLESFKAPLRNAYWQGFEITKVEEHPSGDVIADITLYRHTVTDGVDSCELQYKTYTFDVDWGGAAAAENLVAVDWIADYADPQPC